MNDADVFQPNGLLGGNSLLPGGSQKSSSQPDKGLLGDASLLTASSLSTTSSEPAQTQTQFVPNGLLGTSARSSTPPPSEAGPSHAQSEMEDESGVSTTSPFKSNGLLGPSSSQPAELSQSQDDELPDISDILRPYARTASTTSSGGGFGAAPIVLPRSSVRSSTYDGKTVFLKRKPKKLVPSLPSTSNQRLGNLLDVPLHRLMDELSLTAARTISAEINAPTGTQSASSSSVDNALWIDRYRPKRFVDLLGDERLHREVAAWVKEWDYCVFGKQKGKKRAREGEDSFAPQDEYHRPPEKILLMSGPPGLGKTTLAHIVAKHAGYEVFEINASDARSGQIVEDRIRPALESGFAVGSLKPSLIVIDEIDGATGGSDNSSGFIQKASQLTYERPAKDKRKKKDNKGKRPLLRPIICICNDLYAASLAKLRPVARIVRFTRPADIHIVKRLRDICEWEGLQAEPRALSTLVGIALGDLRGCLNTLQFIKSKNKQVTEQLIRAATSGMKEAESSFLAALNNLFAPMSKKRVKELGLNEEHEARYVDRLSRELDGSGALDRIATGTLLPSTNAKTHQHDATFARYIKANEWLVAYDTLSGAMRAEREYALLPYLSYTLVPFYPLFQERGAMRVERPKADWEAYTQMRTHEEVYKSLARAVRTGNGRTTGHYRALVGEPVLHLEFAPYLNRIISPPCGPQVIRAEEKALLARLVSIMVSLELRFVQEKAEDGQLVYRLDPSIDLFVTYDGKRASDIAVSRYAVRHLVAAEIDAQLIARQADAVERSKAARPSFFGAPRDGDKDRDRPMEDDAADAPDADADAEAQPAGEGALTHERPRKRAKVAAVDIADKPAVDFFGRPIAVPASAERRGAKPASAAGARAEAQAQAAPRAYKVSYRYNEGNSAAVRKPVKVASFL